MSVESNKAGGILFAKKIVYLHNDGLIVMSQNITIPIVSHRLEPTYTITDITNYGI